eukprot:356451-Chlamydomonas_euryale.AAC.6
MGRRMPQVEPNCSNVQADHNHAFSCMPGWPGNELWLQLLSRCCCGGGCCCCCNYATAAGMPPLRVLLPLLLLHVLVLTQGAAAAAAAAAANAAAVAAATAATLPPPRYAPSPANACAPPLSRCLASCTATLCAIHRHRCRRRPTAPQMLCQPPGSREHKAEEQRCGPPRPRLELWVELRGDVERVAGRPVGQLKHLHALPRLVAPHKAQPRGLQLRHELRVDLVAVAVPLVDVVVRLARQCVRGGWRMSGRGNAGLSLYLGHLVAWSSVCTGWPPG